MSQVSLYAHIPLCLRKCDYCDFFSLPLDRFPESANRAIISSRIVDALAAELSIRSSEWGVKEWSTVYIGGGTPSLLVPRDVSRLCKSITDSVSGAMPKEWTVEANPEDITPEWLDACQESGVNRLSIGIQTFDDRCLADIGRRGSSESSLAALSLARTRWKGSISADLITGLPHQTEQSLAGDIEVLGDFGCDHISLYSLTIEEGTPLYKSVTEGRGPALPIEDKASDIWLFGRDCLEKRGYQQYEVSNFAREGQESAHNLIYWHMGSWMGIGPSATGNIAMGDRSARFVNGNDIEAWFADPAQVASRQEISRAETITETLMMGFRTLKGINRKSFHERFGEDVLTYIQKTFDTWERQGLARSTFANVALTRDGIMLLNRFLSQCLEEIG